MSTATRTLPRAFTLVELLVVIALITVFVSLAMPTVLTVRQSALSATCAMNLKNAGSALIAISLDNNGTFPTTVGVGQRADNWIYWQKGRNPGMDACPMARYLSLKGSSLKRALTCPAQPIEDNVGYQNGAAYPVTYTLNYSVSVYYPLSLRRIRNPASKILIYDENQNADDDQFWYGTERDTLAGRHGTVGYQHANLNGAGGTNLNRGLGNVLFLDGRVAMVNNNVAHTAANNDLLQP